MVCRVEVFERTALTSVTVNRLEWGIGNLKAHFLHYTPLQFWQMWPLHLLLTWPLSTVPPVATANFSGSAMLQCSTAMCESTASLSLRSHSLSLFQFPTDYQQQYITSTVGKVPPLPSCTSSSSSPLPLVAQTKPEPQKCNLWTFHAWGIQEVNNGFLIKIFNMAAGVISLSQNLSKEFVYILPNDSSS